MSSPPTPSDAFPTKPFLAQMLHLLGGVIILLAADKGHLNLGKSFCWLLIAAAFKEFVWDMRGIPIDLFGWHFRLFDLESDSFLSSLDDWIFYLLGGISGWLACANLAAGAVAVSMVALMLTLADIGYKHLPQPDDYD